MTRDADHHRELTLAAVNRRLAELLRTEPLPLATGGAKALGDDLWIWGVVGGKNVGKSTLIDALAGADVVERGDDAGEGTYRPTAYATAGDLPALEARLADLATPAVRYCTDAPESMRGLVLVDLPDFDSLFTEHIETVRRIAPVLDGIIWVTTPKKVGDLRAIGEIRQVLKARHNFAYVVNKMDWLLAQSAAPPADELARAASALQSQVADENDIAERSFLIAARYPTADAVLAAVKASRSAAPAGDDNLNGPMAEAARRLSADFTRLHRTLTTAPSAEAINARKRDNLAYQLREQAARLSAHHQPEAACGQLDRALDAERLADLANRYVPPSYRAEVVRRLNGGRRLAMDFSGTLFRRRITYWPLLGWIAWPLAAVGTLLSQLRRSHNADDAGGDDDPFRSEGVALRDRVDGLRSGVEAHLGTLTDRMGIALPNADALERQLRQDVRSAAGEQRDLVLDRMLARRPGFLGRCTRSLLPLAILLWFPLLQPLLAAVLGIADGGVLSLDLATIRAVVAALSAGHVLTGLSVSILILAGMAAAIYSRAVGDAHRAIERLRDLSGEELSDPLVEALVQATVKPAATLHSELRTLIDQLHTCKP